MKEDKNRDFAEEITSDFEELTENQKLIVLGLAKTKMTNEEIAEMVDVTETYVDILQEEKCDLIESLESYKVDFGPVDPTSTQKKVIGLLVAFDSLTKSEVAEIADCTPAYINQIEEKFKLPITARKMGV